MKKTMIWAGLAVLAIAAVGGALAMRSGEKGSAATGSATNAVDSAESTTAAARKQTPPLEFAAADLVTLAARPIVVELAMPGSVQALSQATVRSKLSAEVRQVRVREGERVTAGQVLAQFDTAALQVQLAERTATLASAHAQLAQSERVRGANAQLV
ncbi:MAG: biotin/lipoyl-binding protein, partial [Burkholderiaceae bacterium]|nr:biotin/lipoyl-binding protein [Burkholderiaceae bacterium]